MLYPLSYEGVHRANAAGRPSLGGRIRNSR
jgi:hypothetical protein